MTRETSTETVLRSRLMPRVSFQTMLVLPSIAAVVFAIAYAADQGGQYAKAAVVGLAFVKAMIALGVLLFLISWAASQFARRLGIAIVVFGVLLLLLRLAGATGLVVSPLLGWFGPFGEWAGTQATHWPWLINFQVIGWTLVLFPIGIVGEDEAASPFAEDQLPPQILAPRDPVQ